MTTRENLPGAAPHAATPNAAPMHGPWGGRGDAARQTREGVDAMGRGRAKAKQTKVARELKYFTPDTDLSALERELHSQKGTNFDSRYTDDEGDDDEWQPSDRR